MLTTVDHHAGYTLLKWLGLALLAAAIVAVHATRSAGSAEPSATQVSAALSYDGSGGTP